MAKLDGRRPTKGSVFPYRISNAWKARIVKQFNEERASTHSGLALTLGVVIEHCIRNDIDFTLTRANGGYQIQTEEVT